MIHFNWGLHDLKYVDAQGKLTDVARGKQVSLVPTYQANLHKIVARLNETGARLLWASTTPVPAGADGRIAGDEMLYNAAAARVMAANGIPINDLHAIAAAQITLQLPRNVHFTPAGSDTLARAVAARVQGALSVPTKS